MRSLTSRISASMCTRAVVPRLGVRGDLDPDRDAIGAAQPQQVVGDGAVALQPGDEAVARLRIEKRSASNGRTSASGVSAAKPNISLRWGLAAAVRVSVACDGADVDALRGPLRTAARKVSLDGLAPLRSRCAGRSVPLALTSQRAASASSSGKAAGTWSRWRREWTRAARLTRASASPHGRRRGRPLNQGRAAPTRSAARARRAP